MSSQDGMNGGCLSDEEMAAFVDGRLSDEERIRVVGHLASCARCREIASSVTIAVRDEGAPRVVRFTRRFLPGLAAVAAVLGIVAFSSLRGLNPSSDNEMASLVDAVGTARPLEARISGGFAHGPVAPVTRGAMPELAPDVQIAIARIEKLNTERPSFETGRARAAAFLVEGNIERAVATLVELTARHGDDARAWSDLSAAYLARGGGDDLSRAVEVAKRAVQIDAHLPEAAFNLALAIERLDRKAEARGAWQRYLDLDSTSGWAVEARDHIRRLSQ
jgi:putative zinc finger protein